MILNKALGFRAVNGRRSLRIPLAGSGERVARSNASRSERDSGEHIVVIARGCERQIMLLLMCCTGMVRDVARHELYALIDREVQDVIVGARLAQPEADRCVGRVFFANGSRYVFAGCVWRPYFKGE
jgi:hypothetical protein